MRSVSIIFYTEEYRLKTHRVLWTQSVSRSIWLLATIGLAAVVIVVLMLPVVFVTSWYSHVYDTHSTGVWIGSTHLLGRVTPGEFDINGAAPIAYALFALGIGALLGALMRYTLPALCLGAIAFTFIRVGIFHLRMGFVSLAPVVAANPHGAAPGDYVYPTNIWVSDGGWLPKGHVTPPLGWHWGYAPNVNYCYNGTSSTEFENCVQHAYKGLQFVIRAQTPGHFWSLQLVEAGAFLAIAGICLVATLWVIHRFSR